MEQANHSKDFAVIKDHVDSWKRLSENEIEFEKLSGLSNVVWKVTALSDDVTPKKLIYRVFGRNCELVDRDQENYVFDELSSMNLGPRCYGYSSAYRIEEFCEGDPLPDSLTQSTETRRKLAKKLSLLHACELPKMDRKPNFLKNVEDGIYVKEIGKKLSTATFNEKEKEIINEIIKKLLSKKEIDFLLSVLPKGSKSVTFAHNDLHGGNILHDKQKDRYIFIDFEYSSYNFRAFDIANLFIEAMLDYEHDASPWYKIVDDNHPKESESDLKEFVKYYVFFDLLVGDLKEQEVSKVIKDSGFLKEYLKKFNKTSEFDEKVKEIMEECKVGALISHYHWTLWSVAFSKRKDIRFNYIAYAHDRFKLYEEAKADFLSGVTRSTSESGKISII